MCRLGAKVFGEILTLTHGDNGGGSCPGRSRQGDAKQPDHKYFLTNEHVSEYDKVAYHNELQLFIGANSFTC